MAAEYWTELPDFIGRIPETVQVLADCKVWLLRKGPVVPLPYGLGTTDFWLVYDPEAPEDLNGKTVELTIERYATTPGTGDAPTMDVIVYSHRITERKAR